MTKESIYELQLIDCNCNDCTYLVRLLDKLNAVVEDDKSSQQYLFDKALERKLSRAHNDITNLEKHIGLIRNAGKKIEGKQLLIKQLESSKHGYQGQRSQIQYGVCCKFKKEVTFIPNTYSLETQKCFTHRKIINP